MAVLSNDKTYVTVVKGDTLSEIAEKYASYISGTGIYGSNGKLATLIKINDIENANYIVVGQKIKLTGSSTAKKNTSNTATIKVFGVQSNSGGRTMYATWTWSKSNTENYQTFWEYDTGDGVWFKGEDSTTTSRQSLYTAPQNAIRVRFKVKPISKKRKVNNKETSYWTASWSSYKSYSFSSNPPTTPSGLEASIDNLKLTASINDVDTSVNGINATGVQFRIYRKINGAIKLYKTSGTVKIVNKYVQYVCDVTAGYEYYVECRAVRGSLYSDWSTPRVEAGESAPSAPGRIIECSRQTDNEVYLEWTPVSTAVSYKIEYTDTRKKFGISSDVKNLSTTETKQVISFTSEETGKEWFFRVQAINESNVASKWSPINSIVLGDEPNAPTTWSSSSSAISDDNEVLYLYWIHNPTDKSAPTKMEIELTITKNGVTSTGVHSVDMSSGKVDKENKDDEESTGGIFGWLKSNFFIDTSNETEDTNDNGGFRYEYHIVTSSVGGGTTIEWRVRTAGATKALSEWSIARTVEIYNRPRFTDFEITDYEGSYIETLTQFPINIKALVEQDDNQTPIGYYLTVTANGSYETVDEVGNVKNVSAGEQIYSKYFDVTGQLILSDKPVFIEGTEVEYVRTGPALSASDMDLENNIEYTIECTVSMNSGLTGETSHTFTVAWTDEQYSPNAEISIDEETLTASIRPHCENEDGELIQEVLLSVYRREFDGTFTEIDKDIDNTGYTYVTDPHPSLDLARYRIIAKSKITGAISSYDVPGIPVGEKGIVIQWDEEWTNFDASIDEYGEYVLEDARSEPVWSGSLLRLPYNVDVSDSYKPDVALINYIGRKNPVSYYGTHIGETSSWSCQIAKTDKETLYALRRLAIWMGDVYVREPSGSGYWANITVSFSQNHCEVIIPVTFTITRVEGGK